MAQTGEELHLGHDFLPLAFLGAFHGHEVDRELLSAFVHLSNIEHHGADLSTRLRTTNIQRHLQSP